MLQILKISKAFCDNIVTFLWGMSMQFFRFFVSNVRIRASALLFSSINPLLFTVFLQISNCACTTKTGVPFSGRRFSLSKNLVEFAPAGAKKVQSFSSATCAAKKILLGLQTCEPSASGGQRVRCSQAAHPFVKKYYFLTGMPGHVSCPGMALAFYFAWMLINSVRSLE